MMKKNKWRMIAGIIMSIMLVAAFTACGDDEQSSESNEENAVSSVPDGWDAGDWNDLMKQVAEKDIEKSYEDYVPDEVFAVAKVFGEDRDGDEGTAYVYLYTAEYAAVKDKAYEMAGGSGEAIISFEMTGDGPELTGIEWSPDGDESIEWREQNFPEEYLEKADSYDAYDKNGNNRLEVEMIRDVEDAMGVPVETENLLDIDIDNGTYEIIRTIESGDTAEDYEFDVETVEKGKLSDLTD